MAVRLTVKERSEAGGAEKGTEVLLDDEVITIGRDKACQVVLNQMAVSRTHARLTRDGSLFFVEDLGSAYGTTVNGKALPKGEKRLLRNGDTIAIAQFDVTFDRVADAPANRGSEKTSFIARGLVKDVMRGMGSGEGPYFRIMNGPREGHRVELLDAQELIIGREEGVDVVLKDDLVSRRHAKLRRDWSGTHVEDLGSRNGIKVNKKRTARKTLKDRDELEVGGIRLLYLDPSEVRETPLVLADQEEEGEGTLPSDHDAEPRGEPDDAPMRSTADEDDPVPSEDHEAPDEVPSGDEDAPGYGGDGDADGEDPGEGEDPAVPDEEDEDAVAAPAPGSGGGGNIILVVKDVRKLVPLALMGVVILGVLVLLIAVMAGA
jgi:pSer/pThr/pTyr-binding forkhead associated (FHA) protein